MIDAFRTYGLAHGTLYLLNRLFVRLSLNVRIFNFEYYAQPIEKIENISERVSRRYRIEALDFTDRSSFERLPIAESVISARLRQNAVCLALFREKDDLFTGYMWVCLDSYDEDEVRITLRTNPPGQAAFDFDVFVLPEFRLGYAFAALWWHGARFLKAQGVQTSFSRISRYNIGSRQSHTRLGAYRVARSVTLRVSSWECSISDQRFLPAMTRNEQRFDIDLTA